MEFLIDKALLVRPSERRLSRSAKRPKNVGGGERDRTDDLLNANQMLSQLSYTP